MTLSSGRKPFVEIRNSLHVLERIAGSVKCNEPVVLIGETGTGKTMLVQNLAARLGQTLTVLNLSQQSDVADLLGGFKPMSAQFICLPLYEEFEKLFACTFSLKGNEDFLAVLKKSIGEKNWEMLFSGFRKVVLKVDRMVRQELGSKRKRPLSEEIIKAWENFSLKLNAARAQISASDGMVFSFVEGAFITALKKGEWILLDEVNLAPPETLQRVIGVLEEEGGSLCLAERGDVEYIYRHPNFRIFACMNPATDAGKRDLPFSLRSRFTEYFVDDVLEDEDLILFVNQFMDGNYSDRGLTSNVVQFYKVSKKESEERLQDGANQKPQYSLRSLYRALEYTKKASRNFGFQKAIYDGFCMFFLTLLDTPSAKIMNQLILRHLLGGNMPPQVPFDRYLVVGPNSRSDNFLENYVLTRSVKEQLRNLARAIFIGRYPVLLQGPTSSGKTSLVQYLAAVTGHEFVRINNHEHTDLQEYLGSYITDANGKLVFQEGVLVKAVRHGYWIVLDELNLAPSDVLEALNRLLDDNRELYVPELRETLCAHSEFMLFATQNPPTFYGGRKMLSRAFRNRFVEIHVDEIPQDELCTILERRCEIPDSYAKKMVEVMKELQLRRQSSKVFAGKHGFITPRDLFRWANRFRTFGKSYEDLARDGYYLLAERLRDDAEKKVVQEVLEKQLRVKLDKSDMYKEVFNRVMQQQAAGDADLNLRKSLVASEDLGRIIWTDSMWRLYFLVERCYRLREPVLLVGETGGGKTTVCQLLSIALQSKLHILNCHQYTETSDFLGGFYPVRERSELSLDFKILCEQLVQSKAFKHFPRDATMAFDINQASTMLNHVDKMIKDCRQDQTSHPEVTPHELDSVEQIRERLSLLHQKWCTIFIWQDGPLLQAMKNGDLFLVDEISLADDSVLERLNSVLEPERRLSLAEKGGPDLEKVTAHPQFFLLATMNPGGDYGKKELSPALRNRFTEIWVPHVGDLNELKCIALEKISNPEASFVVDIIMNFWEWFNQLQTGRMLTVRDLLSWIAFINVTKGNLLPEVALLHGAFLVLLDGLSLGTGISRNEAEGLRERCMLFLMGQLKVFSYIIFSHSTRSSIDVQSHSMKHTHRGWPTTLTVRDFVWYSTEASVKQNCMYLEYLGAQMASHSFRIATGQSLLKHLRSLGNSTGTYLVDVKMLHALTYPKSSDEAELSLCEQSRLDVALIDKKLLFAANWAIEQATESDLKMYLLWFRWFGDLLQNYCPFYHSYLKLVEEELGHPIWNCIRRCHGMIMANNVVDTDLLKSIPMLSLDLVELMVSVPEPCTELEPCSELLAKAINCVGLLRQSYHLWHCRDKPGRFAPVLRSLRRLEERILDMLVESPSFNVLSELYRKLLDDHQSAWNGIVSSQFECILIFWRSLTKNVSKLLEFCPSEVKEFQKYNADLESVLSCSFNSQRSLLWVHGGHPLSPSSSEIYKKQLQLVNLCQLIWPREIPLLEPALHRSSIDTAVSANPELRFLAMQGVCMSAYIMSKVDEEDIDVPQQLEEMHQMLWSKFKYEKDKLESIAGKYEPTSFPLDLSSCCALNPDILCRSSALSCWLDTLPLNDYTSIHLDMRLLQELSDIVSLERMELRLGLSRLSRLLESSLKSSLNSSRPPTDFSPHQKIVWVVDAWTSVDSVRAIISSSVLELWFKWHTSLWKHRPSHEKNLSIQHGYHGLIPDMLFQPVKTATLDKILRHTVGIKDFSVHSLKLRAASSNLWSSPPHVAESRSFLFLTARSLFQQIILAHKKSFGADYSSIRSIFCSAQEKMITQADVDNMITLLSSSSHHVLKSLTSSFIKPLLDKLYLQSSRDSLYDLGYAWLHIGGLRYQLLICGDDVDPAVKPNFKYCQLSEKIMLLELEIEVRKECVHLAGCFSSSNDDKKRIQLLEKLKADRKRLRKKIVFRTDPGKFKKLRSECDEFMKLVTTSYGLVKKDGNLNMHQIADQVHNWQETATCFVERLSNEYSEYVDIVQPVQIAIYEMKLGLSLLLSSSLYRQFSQRVALPHDVVLRTIYSLVRFPRGIANKYIGGVDVKELETLVTATRENNNEKTVSVLQLEAAIRHNIVLRVVHSAAEARFLDNESFMLLEKTFHKFADVWMEMKIQVRTKEDFDAQQYRFRPRAFSIKNVIETDVSTLGCSVANEAFSEWQELASEEVSTEGKKDDEEHETLEENWNSLQESILIDMVHIHNTLFGSIDLIRVVGSVQVSDSDRLRLFMDSYDLGTSLIKDLEGLLLSSLDDKLIPEHLLRLCLEHDRKFISSHATANSYNFYKDSKASLMAKMIDPLMNLQQRIHHLLSEWDEHPALQKILDVIEMIVSIPVSTPLAKALSGLQFLLNRVRVLQETVSKFPLSDQLEPILALVSSWQKLELESWPALLDEVQSRFDINAGQLWFPLYSVLRQRYADGSDEYSRSTIKSVEEFIQTSSIGEFRKRLQLLLAFHGQISTAIGWGSKSSYCHEDNLKILYNAFGFYVQFLPVVLERLTSNRRDIEVELNELLKLCRWERSEWYMTMEASKRTRQKFKRLIQKYTDVLQQPVMLILTQEAARSRIKGTTAQAQGPTQFSDCFERSRHVLSVSCNQTRFRNKERYVLPATWRNRIDLAMENMRLAKTIKSDFPFISLGEAEVNTSTVTKCIASRSTCGVSEEELGQVWYTIEKISRAVIDCGELWKDENKSLGKRRALSEFLKLLDSCGLSKHRSTFLEDQLKTNKSSQWFLQPSYVLQHLLLTDGRLSSGDPDVAALENIPNLVQDNVETEWKTANEYFFKSVAALGDLRQVCLNFHKDFTLEQVNRSVSYLDHLMEIQKEQRVAAYDFAESIEHLKKCSLPLQNLFSSPVLLPDVTSIACSSSHNQNIVLKCMLQQKQLFDNICSTLHGECLLLKTAENNHLKDCQSVGAAAYGIHLFLEKFFPNFKNSKEILDNYHNTLVSISVLLHPLGITKQMEQFVLQNFSLVREFKEQLGAFQEQDAYAGSVKDILIGHFEDIFAEGDLIAGEYISALEARKQSGNIEDVGISIVEAKFVESLRQTCKHIVDAFERLSSVDNGHGPSEEALGNISTWGTLFASRMEKLQNKNSKDCVEDDDAKLKEKQFCSLHDKLATTIDLAGELLSHYGNGEPSMCLVIEANLMHLYSLLDLIITFCNGLLNDFLVVLRTVSIMTHVLAKIFASLYFQGYGGPTEDQDDEHGSDKTRDASGTGMGEGAGVKDVSEQIDDEDQLLGMSEKPGEEQDALNDVPSKNDRGIEMEHDFAADTFSVSEDSGGDNADGHDEDQQLESAMGETGADSEIVDEKHCDDKDDNDENPNKKEKYEPGPSVKDKDPSGRELRAKEDSVTTADETGEVDLGDYSRQNDEKNGDEGPDNNENVEDMEIDKGDAFSEPTGLKLDEPNMGPEQEGIDMNEQDLDDEEDAGTDAPDETTESNDGEEENTDASPGQIDSTLAENGEMDDATKNDQEKDMDTNMEEPTKDFTVPTTPDFCIERQFNAESATQLKGNSHAASMRNVAPEAKWSNTSDLQTDLVPIEGLPNASENEITVADSSKGGKLSDDQSNQLPELDPSSSEKNDPNPFRNVGDALDGWKERLKASVDIEDKNDEAVDELEDENAAEYGFTSGLDKGTTQALGPAASDQIDKSIEGKEPADGDNNRTMDVKDSSEMDVEEKRLEAHPIKTHSLNVGNKISEQVEVPEVEMEHDTSEAYDRQEGDQGNQSESLVCMKRSYMHDGISQFGKLSVSDEDLGRAHNLEDVSDDTTDAASALWRRYELLTTRLSQELAEQLRLVMEPTLASKLQGDYKTGKRINMKKVIPYIASHYRKDKIWLRRTRPNKRNYQVVIAIDDSRSMSESHCSDVAIEALVTVCRAMSQLEVGNLAVASFGKKGNIRLLHDFDQQFNGEAGIKMLSSLSFKQENTIADEPMVDLLTYLNNMLDAAAVNARLPSGHNPLEQLVLIIADGRFHEKENLKRCVRDILSKKRMVAFLLLDSPQESITDLMEASFEGGNVKFVKYLDSFPFPFYVVLKDIEALPRTLADLLRQWFELMQQSAD